MSPSLPTRRPAIDRRQFLRMGAGAAGALVLSPVAARAAGATTGPARHRPHRPDEVGADVAIAWFDLATDLVRTTPGFSPPVAARAFGYAGVTLYEAVRPGMRDARSLAGQLDGLHERPGRRGPDRQLHWPLVANAALAAVLRGLIPPGATQTARIDELERATTLAAVGIAPGLARRSRRHGAAVAADILAWAASDGGDQAYLGNFPADYVPPVGPGLWEPTPPALSRALLPTWGTNRTMVPDLVASSSVAPPVAFSTDPGSAFHAEAREVYDTVATLDPSQLDIARYWSDDPGATATPAGHSISILTQVLAVHGVSLELAAEAYARLGIALADAFVCCWATKYQYNVLRPVTYIRATIDPTWGDPLPLTTPPFPEYPSGHSVQSGAMAGVLTAMFGATPFTDHTHDDRGFAPRTFSSFDQAAAEAAISRLYGGIHYRHAIEQGLTQGRAVGDAANRLRLRR